MAEQAQFVRRWYEWLPGWVPICLTIALGFYAIGGRVQSFEDRLELVEKQISELTLELKEVKMYLYAHPVSKTNPPPLSYNNRPSSLPQDAGVSAVNP